MKLNEALKMAQDISDTAAELLHRTGVDEYDYPERIDCFDISADERFELEQLSVALRNLDTFCCKLNYISQPVIAEETLHKNSRGRYESSSHEYTSGSRIEYLTYDSFDERDEWKLSRVEHNGEDYYIVGDKDINLEGLLTRIRHSE